MKKINLVPKKVVISLLIMTLVVASGIIAFFGYSKFNSKQNRSVASEHPTVKEQSQEVTSGTPVSLSDIGLEGQVLVETSAEAYVNDLGLKEAIYRNGDAIFLHPTNEEINEYLKARQYSADSYNNYSNFFYDENHQVVERCDLLSYIIFDTHPKVANYVGLPEHGVGGRIADMGNSPYDTVEESQAHIK